LLDCRSNLPQVLNDSRAVSPLPSAQVVGDRDCRYEGDRSDDVRAQQAEAAPRAERAIGGDGRDRQPRRGRQVRADLLALGHHVHDHGHDEECEGERRDRGGGVAQQRAERETEGAHRGQEEPAAEDGAQHVRIAEGGVDVLGGEDRLPVPLGLPARFGVTGVVTF